MKIDWRQLDETVKELQQHSDIGVSVIAPNNESWSHRGDTQFPAASTIKIMIMIEIYRMIDRGELILDNNHILQAEEKSNGSGILRHMHSGLQLSLNDLLYLMMSISDNTATNILLTYAGMDKINTTMRKLDMTRSILGRPFQGRLAIAGEQENFTTSNDIVRALGAIIGGKVATETACKSMLTMFEKQQNRHRIGRYVPTTQEYSWGSKTGTNMGVVNDAGYVKSSQGTMIIAIYCRGVTDEVTGERIIAEITRSAMQVTKILH